MNPLLRKIRTALRDVANPDDAGPMQKYMKSEMPYWGVKKPARVEATKALLRAYTPEDFEDWTGTITDAWDAATHREERYALIDLCAQRRFRAFHDWEVLPMYEHMIVTGAWWDLVDAIAGSDPFAAIFDNEPGFMTKTMRQWSGREDLWIRRSAIISQLKRKKDTDTELLTACIVPNMADKEFLICKAIGWALRQYSYSDPDWVIAFVDEHAEALSGLSQREGLKALRRQGLV